LPSSQDGGENKMKIYSRMILERILKSIDSRKIQIIFGTRQVGKTTILNLIEKELKKTKKQVWKVNMELPENFNIFTSHEQILNYLKTSGFDLTKKIYLLLDEFQIMAGIGRIFKILYDEFPHIKIIATGSSSLLINRNIKEGLTGRYFGYLVYHFNFLEFLQTKTDTFSTNMLLKKTFLDLPKIQNHLDEYLLFGGFPEIILHQDIETKLEIFSSIYLSYLQKDINYFLRQEQIPKFSQLVELLASRIGSLVNINSLSKILGISNKTIENFIFTLENTFSLKMLNPFFENLSKEIKKMKKVYFYDLGLRNYVLKQQKLPLNAGNLAENFVFLELIRNHDYSIKYWRTKHGTEIDFILQKNQEIIPVEVKYKSNLNTDIVPANIRSFMESYEIKKAFIITKNQQNVIRYKNTEIIYLPLVLSCNIGFDNI